MSKLSGKIVIITGATGAIGTVVTRKFLKEGATVIATHTGNTSSKTFLEEMKRQYPLFSDLIVDVTSESSVDSCIEDLLRKHAGIDMLIHLAGGVSEKSPLEEVPLRDWERMFSINVLSLFLLTRKVLPLMKKRRFGRIVAISARSGVTPEAFRGAYGAAKSTVIALIKTIAAEQEGTGDITANVIAPGIVATEENKRWGTEEDHRRWVTPDDIAEAIVFLCGSAAVNGQIIHMYGKGNP